MSTKSRIRVYIACSLDGFIAGPEDDLSWLPGGVDDPEWRREGGAIGFEEFMATVGALLMGRRTYDVVVGFPDEPWPYGDRPVLVATHRPLEPVVTTVQPISGSLPEMVAAAQAAAGDLDVYIDGGSLIRQAMDEGLVDELILTISPTLLGEGTPLFAGVTERHALEFLELHRSSYNMVQLRARPRRTGSSTSETWAPAGESQS